MHAVSLVIETAVLVWMTLTLSNAFTSSADAISTADIAAANSDGLRAEQDAMMRRSEEKQHRISGLIDDFRADVMEKLNNVATRILVLGDTAFQLSGTAETTTERVGMTSQVTDQMKQNVQSVAGAAGRLSVSISEIREQVGQTTGIVQKATDITRSTNEKVAGLAEGAQKIGEVVNLIQDIAE